MKSFEKKTVLKWLVSFNIILVILYLITNHIIKRPLGPLEEIRQLFDLNGETNIPAWFSSAQLFLIFVLSIFYSIQIENGYLRRFYCLIGLVFLFFSADEISQIHEGITKVSHRLSIYSFFPNAHGMWILVYPLVLFILGLIFWREVLAFWNEKNGRTIFIIGAVVFVIGGVGFEIWSYYLPVHHTLYIIEGIAEESFEMLGQSLMIYALLSKLHEKGLTH